MRVFWGLFDLHMASGVANELTATPPASLYLANNR